MGHLGAAAATAAIATAATGSKLLRGSRSGDDGAMAIARPPAKPGHDFELVAVVLLFITSPFPCVCCSSCCGCCRSDGFVIELGRGKGPELGSGGNVGTSCDCDGKGTSVLALALLLLVQVLHKTMGKHAAKTFVALQE